MPSNPPDAAQLPLLTPAHNQSFLQLHRLLWSSKKFMLIFLEYGEKRYRDTIIEQLKQIGHHGAELIMQPCWDSPQPLLDALAALPPDPTPVHLLEFGPWLRPNYCQAINFARDALAVHANRPLLIWLERQQLKTLALEAPDLWSWRYGAVLNFSRPGTPQTFAIRSQAIHIQERNQTLQRIHETSFRVASLLKKRGDLYMQLDNWKYALNNLNDARHQFDKLKTPNNTAWTVESMADLELKCDKSEQTLNILKTELLPVYENLGDIRSEAVIMGKIADIFLELGQLDEALAIYKTKQLPVFEKLANLQEYTITKRRISDILKIQEELDETLCIRTKELLTLCDQLEEIRDNIREYAIIKGRIADIRKAQGELDEALTVMSRLATPPMMKDNHRWVATARSRMEMEAPTLI
ncbi:MAG: hypothetical protein H7839_20925, partial [Magnetococcus sp. YQC-5]